MKKYLKTPEAVISALKEGKTVHSNCGKYKIYKPVGKAGGLWRKKPRLHTGQSGQICTAYSQAASSWHKQ